MPEGLGVIGDLKPCPFCGGKARLSAFGEGVNIWAAVCVGRGCKCYSPVLNSRAEAIEKWNRRASGEAAEKALEELKCIASEMAKALRAVRDMHRAHCLIEPEQPCATCTDEWLCPGRVADKARREWEQWEEGQS